MTKKYLSYNNNLINGGFMFERAFNNISKLQDQELFKEKLKKDIEGGKVFPALSQKRLYRFLP